MKRDELYSALNDFAMQDGPWSDAAREKIVALFETADRYKRKLDEAVVKLRNLVTVFDEMGLVGIDDPKDDEVCRGQVELASARVFLASIAEAEKGDGE